jgi:hypothetical protein
MLAALYGNLGQAKIWTASRVTASMIDEAARDGLLHTRPGTSPVTSDKKSELGDTNADRSGRDLGLLSRIKKLAGC